MDTLSQFPLPIKEQENNQNETLEHFLYAQTLEAAPVEAQELVHLTWVHHVLPKVKNWVLTKALCCVAFIFHAILVLTMNQCELAHLSIFSCLMLTLISMALEMGETPTSGSFKIIFWVAALTDSYQQRGSKCLALLHLWNRAMLDGVNSQFSCFSCVNANTRLIGK